MARSLDQEGLSQGAIAKELGVNKATVNRWLQDDRNGESCNLQQNGSRLQSATSLKTSPRYLVVCQSVEKFRPPAGITFPLIIAKELGVSQRTISNWLNLSTDDDRQQNLCKTPSDTNFLLPTSKPPHYLVVCQSVEKFRPLDGITFPLITAKELGVSKSTISGWLKQRNNDDTSAISEQQINSFKPCTSGQTVPRYLVVCQSVEKPRQVARILIVVPQKPPPEQMRLPL